MRKVPGTGSFLFDDIACWLWPIVARFWSAWDQYAWLALGAAIFMPRVRFEGALINGRSKWDQIGV